MTSIISYVTNNKKSPLTLFLSSGHMYSLNPGETKKMMFDIWSIATKPMKAKLEKYEKEGVITVKTQVISGGKVIETTGSDITITDYKSTSNITGKPKSDNKKPDTKTTGETQRSSAALFCNNNNYRIAGSEDNMAKFGARPVTEKSFDNTRGMHNNVNTHGFEVAQETKHDANIFNRQSNIEKINAPGLFKNGTPVTETAKKLEQQEQPAAIAPAVAIIAPIAAEVILALLKDEDVQKLLVDYGKELIKVEYIDKLLEVLKKVFPGTKFTKAKLKSCKTFGDIKTTFNI